MRRYFLFTSIVAASTATLVFLSYLAYGSFVDNWNRQQLNELSEQTILRTEVAIDRSIISLMDLVGNFELKCSADLVAAIQKKVFAVGSLKDVYFSKGRAPNCSGFPDLGPTTKFDFKDVEHHVGLNEAFFFSLIKSKNWSGLSVGRSFDEEGELIAIMSADSLLFDMLPASLREHATMELSINDGPQFAEYRPANWKTNTDKGVSSFTSVSNRYPVTARINVDQAKLIMWKRDVPVGIALIVVSVSVLFGILLARNLVQPPSLAQEVDSALNNGEIIPYFQPILCLNQRRIVGCEMLARWIKADGTHISPGQFIPIIELSGRADKLMETLLRHAGKSLATFYVKHPELKLTFNVTPEQFLSPGFASRTINLVNGAGLPASQLFVELTERQELKSIDGANIVAEEFAKAGIRVAIDDAGTGHNGLASIQNLNASCLKIDKLFIDHVDQDQRTQTMVEMLVNLAREYQMSLVAEGIERSEQVEALCALGVSEGQGFLFSRPVPADEFRRLVKDQIATEETGYDAETIALEGGLDFDHNWKPQSLLSAQ